MIPLDFILRSARYLARACMQQKVTAGDHVVDATAGNGHDTLFLAELVGENGHVTAFDIQKEAIDRTKELLNENHVSERVTLILDGHQNMDQYLDTSVSAVMFNLGWLPGGDKSITTLWSTTQEAIQKALDALLPLGVCTICVYPGHAEGAYEKNELATMLSQLRPQEFNVLRHTFINAGTGAPECYIIQKQL